MNYSFLRLPLFAVLAFSLGASAAFADHSAQPLSPVPDDDKETAAAVHAAPVAVPAADDCHIDGNLALGSRSAGVSCLQQALIDAGFLRLSAPTGYFGALTEAAVKEWQAMRGVPATGFFGALSRAAFDGHAEAAEHEHEAEHPAEAAHAHEPIDVSAWPAIPSVSIALEKDAMSGYNLRVTPVNYAFAPEHVNNAVAPNEGHAHVYIDGAKFARLYGPWMHIPPEAFKGTGEHEVVVTLNANDHSELAQGGARIEASQHVIIE